MANSRFVQEYQKGAVNGASPLQLVIMLYDGAIRFMEAGKHAMAAREIERQNHSIQKAQRIVMELMACLDMDRGGDIAKNLLAIYSYVLNQLIEANLADDPAPIDCCMKILSDLRESWGALESTIRQPSEQPLAA